MRKVISLCLLYLFKKKAVSSRTGVVFKQFSFLILLFFLKHVPVLNLLLLFEIEKLLFYSLLLLYPRDGFSPHVALAILEISL